MVSRAQFIIAVALLAVAIGAAFLLLPSKPPGPAPEVVMDGGQFAQEHAQYKVSPPRGGPYDGYYDFPSLAPGDILRIRDRIASLEYDDRTRATAVVLSGFEGSDTLGDGLFFAGNLTGRYKIGDPVQITFHVVQTTVKYDNATVSAELLDEWNGKARESSPDGIPAGAIRRYG
ncbi:MAG: hypothetical protein FJ149_08045 [Euryarchaeota archaeon]|nr:hypothetical protein [Euryarchaeota archaeon]